MRLQAQQSRVGVLKAKAKAICTKGIEFDEACDAAAKVAKLEAECKAAEAEKEKQLQKELKPLLLLLARRWLLPRSVLRQLATCRGETGHPVLTCPGLTAEDAPQASDLITVGGAWYSVADSYDAAGAPTALHLAEAHSSAVDTSYQGASGDELAVRGWAGGYEYE